MHRPLVIKQSTGSGQEAIPPGMISVPLTIKIRVVVGTQQVVGTRPAAPAITLQTLQGLQPGQQGHLLLKTENGQYQLLRVGPAPSAGALTAPQPQAIRLSSVPTITLPTSTSQVQLLQGPQLSLQGNLLLKTPNGQYLLLSTGPTSSDEVLTTPQPQANCVSSVPTLPGVATASTSMASLQIQAQMPLLPAPVPAAMQATMTMPAQAVATPERPTVTTQRGDDTKEKCRNFLATLLDTSSREPKSVERNVRTLIQELIDAQVEPEEFCDRLGHLLNARLEPCLIGFLKESLPLLRQSLVTHELVIEGINPPAAHVAFSSVPAPTQPIIATSSLRMADNRFEIMQDLKSQLKFLEDLDRIDMKRREDSEREMLIRAAKSRSKNKDPKQTKLKAKATEMRRAQMKELRQREANLTALQAIGPRKKQRLEGAAEQASVRAQNQAYAKEMQRAEMEELRQREANLTALQAIGPRKKQRLEGAAEQASVRAQNQAYADNRFENTQDVKSQLKFLEDLDRVDKKQREDSEREVLIRATKSRSKNEDQEQAKLKAKATEMRRAQMKELRQREANLTALQAIGPRKKQRLEGAAEQASVRAQNQAYAKEMQRAEMEELRQREANLTALQAIGPRKKQRLEGAAEQASVRAQNQAYADNRFENTQDVKSQLKFLEDLDRVDKKQREDSEREMLIRATKSRSKNEDQEQAKLKAKAKEMQRAEMEELRQREANLTALQAIGPRKKQRLEGAAEQASVRAQNQAYADNRFENTQDVKSQLKFLEDLDRVDKKQREDSEREMLIRATKSRSKTKDPKQAKLKAKAKEMQRAEMEELRQREANLTALQAIGPRKKQRLEGAAEQASVRAQNQAYADNRFENTQDVKSQLKFLEDLDRVDKKQREDSEREVLIRATKSRSKNEDQEQAKLKAKAKEMQRAEMEELRQREANLTALQAIGPRKKQRLEGAAEQASVRAQNQAYADNRFENTQDVKSQLKFLEDLDRVDKKQREDSEREMLIRATKSRSKNEDQEQAKLKAKAKEMQRAEMEELRQREANLTALQAIGPRKKQRLEGAAEQASVRAQNQAYIKHYVGNRFENTQDVKSQLKFLEDLDRVDKKQREDSEREMLIRATMSRSKNEDQEQAKLKAKAKEMQRAEMEELRQREANLTALQAIGPRKKQRLEGAAEQASVRAQNQAYADNRFENTQDVKSQLKFLEDLDRVDKKQREDSEREMLIRATMSRSKNEDQEQAKLKAKAKEMQRAEMEELRQREANLTALQAIGPRKKQRLEGAAEQASVRAQNQAYSGRSQTALQSRLKRINHQDML